MRLPAFSFFSFFTNSGSAHDWLKRTVCLKKVDFDSASNQITPRSHRRNKCCSNSLLPVKGRKTRARKNNYKLSIDRTQAYRPSTHLLLFSRLHWNDGNPLGTLAGVSRCSVKCTCVCARRSADWPLSGTGTNHLQITNKRNVHSGSGLGQHSALVIF